MKKIIFNNDESKRLDVFLTNELKLSRNKITSMIKLKKIKVNDKDVKNGFALKKSDVITIDEVSQEESNYILKECVLNLEICYEDDYLMIVNKPSGLIVHPTSFIEDDTLSGAVKKYFKSKNINFPEDDYRWGVCHRLDKDTSGLIVVAKSIDIQQKIQEMIKNNKVKREYIGLIFGKLKAKKIKIDAPIKRNQQGKINMDVSQDKDALDAVTYVEEIEKFKSFSLVKFTLETGRTHQIRVHSKYINNPIINDPLYGNKKTVSSYNQYLHAYRITFLHPITNENIFIELKMPTEFSEYIKKYGE